MFGKLITFGFLFFVLAATDWAQKSCDGVFGRTTSVDGWIVPDAKITVRMIHQPVVSTSSDGNGEFSVCLNPGKYQVLVQAPGYKQISRRFALTDGKLVLDFVLHHKKESY